MKNYYYKAIYICLLNSVLTGIFGCGSFDIHPIDSNGNKVTENKFNDLETIASLLEKHYSNSDLSKRIDKNGLLSTYSQLYFTEYCTFNFPEYNTDVIRVDTGLTTYVYSEKYTQKVFTFQNCRTHPFIDTIASVWYENNNSINNAGYIDIFGNVQLLLFCSTIGPFINDIAVFGNKHNNILRFGLIGKNGIVYVNDIYSEIYNSDCIKWPATIRTSSTTMQSGLIDQNGKFILTLREFEEVRGPLINNVLLVKYNDTYRFVNSEGNVLVDFSNKWDEVYPLYNKRALIRQGDNYGYVDEKGKIVIEPKYSIATNFVNGIALVSK